MAREPRGVLESPPARRLARGGRVAEALGARIRHQRQAAGMTVRGLAAGIGVSPSLISQIERGRATPSVATLWSIATALGLPVSDLFSGSDVEIERAPAGVNGGSPVQVHETRKAITLAEGVRWERLTTAPDSELDFIYVVYPPGAASCAENALTRHGGREFGYVISGTLAVEMGFEEYILRPNDSISFESTTPHRLRAVGDKPAVAVWAVIHRDGDARPDAFGT
jgi:transcriptional regulator with XRE-family HTH domain